MTDMEKLRAELVRRREIDYRDLKGIRWLSPGRQAHNDRIIRSLDDISLASRMRDCGDIDAHGNIVYCRVPQCSRCSMVRRRKETAKAIHNSFYEVPNERLAFVTILLPVTPLIENAGASLDQEKRRLINLVARKRRQDSRWNGFHMTGFWELDRIAGVDLPKLSEQKQAALGALGAPVFAFHSTSFWVPHLHAIVDLGALSVDELRRALRGDGRHKPYQLHVERFHTHRHVNQNLQRVIRYCLKFRLEDDYKGGYGLNVLELDTDEKDEPAERNWWPTKDISAYVSWAKTTKAGFRSLRFEIGRAGSERAAHEAKVKAHKAEQRSKKPSKKKANGRTKVGSSCSGSQEHVKESVVGSSLAVGVGCCVGCIGCVCRYKELLLDTNCLCEEQCPGPPRCSEMSAAAQFASSRGGDLGQLQQRP